MPLFKMQDLCKSFGGLLVSNNLSFEAGKGEITTLIGPNGAGKTTVFNIISGILAPDSGNIYFDGKSLINLPPYKRCEMGIGRTFQITQIFDEYSVLVNVMMGFHCKTRAGFFSTGLRTPRCKCEEKEVEAKSFEILEFLNLSDKAYELAKNLTFGEQRLVELGRTMASKPKLVLLDEPVSGFNRSEANRFGELLKRMIKEGFSILLISHDMGMVMDISDKIVVINYGIKISEGTPSVVRNDESVINSYLGRA